MGRRLREYISVAKVAFDATNGGGAEAKAMVVVAQAELAGELGFTFFVS